MNICKKSFSIDLSRENTFEVIINKVTNFLLDLDPPMHHSTVMIINHKMYFYSYYGGIWQLLSYLDNIFDLTISNAHFLHEISFSSSTDRVDDDEINYCTDFVKACSIKFPLVSSDRISRSQAEVAPVVPIVVPLPIAKKRDRTWKPGISGVLKQIVNSIISSVKKS